MVITCTHSEGWLVVQSQGGLSRFLRFRKTMQSKPPGASRVYSDPALHTALDKKEYMCKVSSCSALYTISVLVM